MPDGDVFGGDLGQELIGVGVDPVGLTFNKVGSAAVEGELHEVVDGLAVHGVGVAIEGNVGVLGAEHVVLARLVGDDVEFDRGRGGLSWGGCLGEADGRGEGEECGGENE